MKNKTTPTRDSLVFYRSFWDSIGRCPDGVQLALFRAVIAYGLDQMEPDFSGVDHQPFVEAIWAGIRPQLDANIKRWENGCKGGCPTGTIKPSMRGNQNARKKQNQNKTESKPNDNDNKNENGNESILSLKTTKTRRGTREDSLSLPYNDPEFIRVWNVLITQPKWRNKTDQALRVALTQLGRYDVGFAIELMNLSIAGNYQGVVFPDTKSRYKQWQQSHPQPDPRTTNQVITDIDNLYND